MAKKEPKAPKKGVPDRHVRAETLRAFGVRNMTVYAMEVNLGRAVPDIGDGLKPVQRRVLFGASAIKGADAKTARVVGDVLGKYHPHGDKSVGDAITTLITSAPVPTMFGLGNWGGLLDNAAAMRYTNCGLTAYGRLMFDTDYFNEEVTQFIPNYDGRDLEPVTLPAQMPHVLMTGAEGIGYGITTVLPSFTPESLLKVMRSMLKKEKLERADFAKILKPMFRYGGQMVQTKANKAAWSQLFHDSEATVLYEAPLEINRPSKSFLIREWPMGLTPDKFIEKVRAMKETKAVSNVEDDVTFLVECRSDFNYDQFDKYVEKVQAITRKSRAYKVNVTERKAIINDGVVSYETTMLAMPVPELIARWLRYRLALELKSLTYRIAKQAKLIHHSELLIYASDHLDVIFKALRRPDTEEFLVKALKKPMEDVKTILELKVRQLSRLDQDALKKKLKEQQAHQKQLMKWEKNPRTKVLLDFERVEEALAADAKAKLKRDRDNLKMT